MVVSVIMPMFVRGSLDDPNIGLAVDGDAYPGAGIGRFRFTAHDGAELLADNFEVRVLAGRVVGLRDGGQNILRGCAIDGDIDRNGLSLDWGRGLGGAIQNVQTNTVTGLIVRQLRVMTRRPEFDDMAAVNAFVGMRVTGRGRRIAGGPITATAQTDNAN
jgi:hypothetical protein